MANGLELNRTVTEAVEQFQTNRACQRVQAGSLSLEEYQQILLVLFPQTYEGPGTFALAGALCPSRFQIAKDYLLTHAVEEKDHWQWVIDDLRATGYSKDPRKEFPHPACQAYIAFNTYVSLRRPIARLGIALALESIGASCGGVYGELLSKNLGVRRDQMSFFVNHGVTDVTHIKELWNIVDCCQLDDEDWGWMCHAAKTAGIFYKAMYDQAIDGHLSSNTV